jgi:hypothetical protein
MGWIFGKKKEADFKSKSGLADIRSIPKGKLVKAQRSVQELNNALNATAEIRRQVGDRLGAIYSEIAKLEEEVDAAHKQFKHNPLARKRLPTCGLHFSRAKYHVSRIIHKMKPKFLS